MKPKLNTQILEEAAEWLVEFSAGEDSPATRKRFDAWLRTSPEHVRAFLELLPVWEDTTLPARGEDLGPEALIAWARNADNIVPLSSSPLPASGERARVRGFAPRYLALAASILIAVAGLLVWQHAAKNSYATQIGEQRSIAFPDGSTVELNSRSRLKVHFSRHERRIDLLEGQALFRVAADPARPFVVHSDEASVRVIGTQFDVYRRKTGTIVTVLEGRVAVSSLVLSAGEQVTLTPAAAPQPKPVNVAAATAWTQRRLVFDYASLAEVAEEFNRYNARQLQLADAELADFRVSGVFSSTDPASLLRFLREQPGIEVAETAHAIRISRPGH